MSTKYVQWFIHSVIIGAGLTLIFLLTNCSYGTYNATGSYPSQTNDDHRSNCNQIK